MLSVWPSLSQPAQPGPGCKLLLTAMNDFIFMNGGAAGGSNTPPLSQSENGQVFLQSGAGTDTLRPALLCDNS